MKLACLFLAGGLCATAADILTTIHDGDVEALKRVLKSGADANAADDRGTTALHYAALYSSREAMAMLIEAGARVDAPNKAGATPLLTAIGDLAKVRLLVEKGADVNAGSALRNAADLTSGAPVAEYLLSKGAKPDAGVLSAAVRRNHLSLATRLIAAGIVPNPNSVNSAASTRNPAMLRAVLFAKTAPDGQSRRTALMAAAYFGPAENVRMLLEHRVDVNAKDNRGRTALMNAAGSDFSGVDIVQLLLAKGADATVTDERSQTALDFARMRGDAAKIRALGGEPAAQPVPPTQKSPPPVRTAIERALRLFDAAGPAFFKVNACISCHHQSIPQMAAAEAGMESAHSKPVLAIWRGETDRMWQTSCAAGGGGVATLTYGLVGLGAAKEPANPTIDAAVHCLAKVQNPDGSWPISDMRQPLGMDPVKYTALAVRALQLYPLPGLKDEFEDRTKRARAFLESAESKDTQSLAFRLLGMKWAGSDASLIRVAAARLLAAQRADGGWAQVPSMESDAYATGQAVWALWAGAGVSRDDPAWRRGVQYLRTTQKEDGSWHVRSRGFGFQPYRDTGFPYGHDQWISSAATGFAVMALAPLMEASVVGNR